MNFNPEELGLGGTFLKTLSICLRRCVARCLEFEMIRVRGKRNL